VTRYVATEILNHSRLRHPHVVQFREVFLSPRHVNMYARVKRQCVLGGGWRSVLYAQHSDALAQAYAYTYTLITSPPPTDQQTKHFCQRDGLRARRRAV
jgi:hypothetical protein